MYGINSKLEECYTRINTLNSIDRNNIKDPHSKRAFRILNLWLIYFDSNADNGVDGRNVDYLLQELFESEWRMGVVTRMRRQFDRAEGHCQRSLAYSKRVGLEGEEKTTMMFDALLLYSDLREKKDNYLGAVEFAEEAYNLVAEAYDPVHPQV
jgi:hypothetical protein